MVEIVMVLGEALVSATQLVFKVLVIPPEAEQAAYRAEVEEIATLLSLGSVILIFPPAGILFLMFQVNR